MTRITTAATLLLIATPLAAQDSMNTDDTQQWGTRDNRDDSYLMAAEDIDVLNNDGDKIGEIEAVLLDENGVPSAFHLEVGGWLDIGDEDVAVPLKALTHRTRGFVSKLTEQQLENLPEWDG
jgi:hypothetical protein